MLPLAFCSFNILYLFGENERAVACPSNLIPSQGKFSFHQKEGRAHSVRRGISEIFQAIGQREIA